MIKVSLIIPAYKAEEWIGQCLARVDAQTYRNIELIVIEDKYATGAAASRNRGLEKATGEYVAFCDADDYLEYDAIEKMAWAMEGVDMVVSSYQKFGAFDQVVAHHAAALSVAEVAAYVMQNLRDPSKHQMLSGCWSKMYRRELLGRFPILTTAEDMALNFDYLAKCKSVRFLSSIAYYNRKHKSGSLTTTFDDGNKSGLFGFLEGLKHMKRFLSQFYAPEEIEDALDNSKVYHAMLYFMRICNQEGGLMRDTFKKLYP